MVSAALFIAKSDAAIAYWMKTSIFLTSFFSMKSQRVEALDLAGDLTGELRHVEAGDAADAAPSRAQRCPVGLGADAERRHQPNPGHDDSPAQTASVRWRQRRAGARPAFRAGYFLALACCSM